jgi:hypothetical protein
LSVQQTQKSFSTAVVVELRRLAASSKKGFRSAALSFAKLSIDGTTP